MNALLEQTTEVLSHEAGTAMIREIKIKLKEASLFNENDLPRMLSNDLKDDKC